MDSQNTENTHGNEERRKKGLERGSELDAAPVRNSRDGRRPALVGPAKSNAGQYDSRRIAVAGCAVMAACVAIGVAIGRLVLPLRNAAHPGGIFAHLLSWDASIYLGVAANGYSWDPVHGMLAGHYQNIEFFPLAPLLDWLVDSPFLGFPAMPVVLMSLAFGFVSVFTFARLASATLPEREASWATLAFSVWPAASFYAMGYPTGLISVVICLALLDHLEGRYWRSALWCGIGSSLAPTMVFIIAGLGLYRARHWLARGLPIRAVPSLVGWGLLCISGLLAFMAYQLVRFGDPFAFSKAAEAWGPAPPLGPRLHRLIEPHWYLQQLYAARSEIRHGFAIIHAGGGSVHAMTAIEAGIQRTINVGTMVVVIAGLVALTARLRTRAPVVVLTGWIVLVGYIWFIFTTDQNMLAVPRLMLPAVGLFLGLGLIASRLGRVGRVLAFTVLAVLAVAETAFAASGYWVV